MERAFSYGMGLVVVYVGVLGGMFLERLWFVDASGQPIAVDFVAFWASGFFTAAHTADAIYDFALYKSAEVRALGHGFEGMFPWSYPPSLLLLTTPLAALSYLVAWLVWTVAGAALFVGGLRRIVPARLAVPLALAGPAALWCAAVGQNGFLTAGLMAFALGWLERRPLLAGVCVGLLTYKPQFGVLLPLFLIVTRQGRAFAAAAITTLLLIGISTTVFGAGSWRAFLVSLSDTGGVLMAGGSAWFKLQSFYSIIYQLTQDATLALRVHLAVCAGLVALLLRLWTRPVPLAVKSAALVAGSYLITPYAYVYDAVLLTSAVALLARDGLARGFLRGDRLLLSAAWLAPGLFMALGSLSAPLGCALILAVAVRRGRADLAVHPVPHYVEQTGGGSDGHNDAAA
jgi:hypothetical protein